MNHPLGTGVRVILLFRGALSDRSIPLAISDDVGIAKATARNILRAAERKASKEKTLPAIGRAKALARDLKLVLELAG